MDGIRLGFQIIVKTMIKICIISVFTLFFLIYISFDINDTRNFTSTNIEYYFFLAFIYITIGVILSIKKKIKYRLVKYIFTTIGDFSYEVLSIIFGLFLYLLIYSDYNDSELKESIELFGTLCFFSILISLVIHLRVNKLLIRNTVEE